MDPYKTTFHRVLPDDRLDRIHAAYEAATGEWLGADWTHEAADGSDCDGGRPCEVCRAAERAAERAEMYAAAAVDAAERCDWAAAVDAAESAAGEERTWGDAPTWAPFVAAVRAAVAVPMAE